MPTGPSILYSHPLLLCIKGCFILLITTLMACSSDLNEIEEVAEMYAPTVEKGTNISLWYNEEGQQRIKLTAPLIVQHKVESPYIEFPSGLQVWFYSDSMTITSTLSAKYAIRYEKEAKTIFKDSVVIHNQLKEEVYTEEMTWDEKEETVYGDQFIRIITPDKRITGKGFTADQTFTTYTIQQITGQVYVQSNKTDEDI